MKATSQEYSKMLASFDINSLPTIASEVRCCSGGCFINHSDEAEDRLISASRGKKSLAIMRDLVKG